MWLSRIKKEFDGPCRFAQTETEYLEFAFGLKEQNLGLPEILQSALWPILEDRDGHTGLRDVDTTEPYHLCKRIFGANTGTDLMWFKEALEDHGIILNPQFLRERREELERAVTKFLSISGRVQGGFVPYGFVALHRIWNRIELPCPDDVEEAKKCDA